MGEVIRIESFRDAMSERDKWEAHARRLSVILTLCEAQRDATALLLSIAEDEILKLRGLK